MGQIAMSAPIKEKENVSRFKTKFPFLHIRQGRRKPTLRIGQVISVSDPQQKFPTTYIPNQVPNFDTTVDVKVKVGEQQLNFEKLPSTAQIANSGTNGVVVSDSRDAMCAEVDSMLRQAKGILESVDYNKAVVESCDEIIAKLNPQIAKDKQQEQDISNLKSDMNGVKGTLSEIKSLLSDALKLSKN